MKNVGKSGWFSGLMAAICITPAWISFAVADVLTVKLSMVDDQGAPVPYATVGSIWIPFGEQSFYTLRPEDMWRTLNRNPTAWEYWNSYLAPLRNLLFSGLTDKSGVLTEALDYTDALPRRSRPSEWTVAYAAYRQGYEPAQAQVTAQQSDKEVQVRLVLRRAKDYRTQDPAPLRTLYEVRREISDRRANEHITRENQQRLEGLRKRLEQAAEEAIGSGDRKTAAAIYYWVAHLPEITGSNGRLSGYAQTNVESTRNIAAMEKSASFDPDNIFVQATWLGRQAVLINRANQRGQLPELEWIEQRRSWLEQALVLDKKAGSQIYPNFHSGIESTLGFLGRRSERLGNAKLALRYYQDSLDKLLWLQSFDPKFADISSDIRVRREDLTRVKKAIEGKESKQPK